MVIKQAEFMTSVADMKNYPDISAPEIVMVGRSNAGKSSCINYLAESSLARVGAKPGLTRLINLYRFNNGDFTLVDLPGYGFQAGARIDKKKWGGLIERYLEYRKELKLVLFLVDIRHDPSVQDLNMLSYLNYLRIPFVVLASKADKLSKSRRAEAVMQLDKSLGIGKDNIIVFSALKKIGKEQVFSRIEQALETV